MTDIIKIGIDAGGTFTDFVISWPDGRIHRHKELSDRDNPSGPVNQGLQVLSRLFSEDERARVLVVHGTTIGLNYLLQDGGARIGLVVSKGTLDMLGIARQKLDDHLNFHAPSPRPAVPRNWTIEVATRLNAAGQVLQEASAAELDEIASRLATHDLDVVVVSLVNAPSNTAVETALAEALASRMANVKVVACTSVWPEVREYERTIVSILNARILPLLGGYLSRLSRIVQDFSAEARLQVTTSAGGVIGLSTATQRPVETLLSGPASGAVAAASLSDRAAISHAVTFDMGGTSADIAILTRGRIERSTSARIGNLPLMMPVVGINSIGAGGGSIVAIDAAGMLRVGPESAGSTPGPAAYGRGGTRPTITDCYVVTGIIDPDNFLGGRVKLDKEAARQALIPIMEQLGMPTLEATAEAGLKLATARMSTELLKTLAEGGHDPMRQTLIPFGGAGPTHAAILADDAGLHEIAVPNQAATFCAFGAVVSPVRRDWILSVGVPQDVSLTNVHALWRGMEDNAQRWLEEENIGGVDVEYLHSLDMRYAGQSHNLVVSIPATARLEEGLDAIREALHQHHEHLYGFREIDSVVEVVSVRLSVLARTSTVPSMPAERGEGSPAAGSRRGVYYSSAWLDTAIYSRENLLAGQSFAGPAVIEQDDTTTFLPPGWTCRIDDIGLLRLKKGA